MNIDLLDLQTVLRKIGRGVIAYAHAAGNPLTPVRWDGLTEFPSLGHLGDTQGEIVVNHNTTIAPFTLEEISGEGVYEATHTGDNPTVEIPLFMADPSLFPIVSPTGTEAGGFTRVQDVAERTIIVFPERLFKNPNGAGYGRISWSGTWTFTPPSGAPQVLTAAQQTLLALSVWFPRGYFSRPNRRFLGGHGNDAKNIETVTFQSMMHPEMPDGKRLFWYGDPADHGINLLGQS